MTKYFVTQVVHTVGVPSFTETPETVSPNFPNPEAAKKEALKLSGLSEEDADWWASESGSYLELHRPNGTWTGYAIKYDR